MAIPAAFVALWWFEAEAFLSHPQRLPAEVLVVEGWIGSDGVSAAKAEFESGGYAYIVATSGLTGEKWNQRRWSYATETEEQLLRMGLPREKVVLAVPKDVETHRTYESAVAVSRTLLARGIRPKAIDVFTMGPHARRSRLVFDKVFAPGTDVGVVPWLPPGFHDQPWWHSSERASDLIKESVGYLFEALLNSGRRSNSPVDVEAGAPAASTKR